MHLYKTFQNARFQAKIHNQKCCHQVRFSSSKYTKTRLRRRRRWRKGEKGRGHVPPLLSWQLAIGHWGCCASGSAATDVLRRHCDLVISRRTGVESKSNPSRNHCIFTLTPRYRSFSSCFRFRFAVLVDQWRRWRSLSVLWPQGWAPLDQRNWQKRNNLKGIGFT